MTRHPSMRRTRSPRLRHTTSGTPASTPTHRHRLRPCSLAGLCAGLIAAVLWPAGTAHADSISLSVTPEPVQELTSQITYQAYAEELASAVVYVNARGVPCAPNPEADVGTLIIAPITFGFPEAGSSENSGNYTPPSTGAYTACGWLYRFDGEAANGRGPVTASSSIPLDVRAPKISLALSLPHPARRSRRSCPDRRTCQRGGGPFSP
jgi:hypothetical protein